MATGFEVKVGINDLIRINRTKGAAALMAALRENGGEIVATAAALGVDHATVKRWIAKLGIRDRVEKLRSQKGLSVARTAHRAQPKVSMDPAEPTAD